MRGSPRNTKPPLEINSLSAIEHILQHRPSRIQRIVVQASSRRNPRVEQISELSKRQGIAVDIATNDRSPEPVKAYISSFVYTDLGTFIESVNDKGSSLVLALDHLQDPQNFGALCRTAEGLGLSGVLLPKDRSVTVGAGVYHASVGAVETVPIVLVNNLGEALRKLKEVGYWIIGTQLGGDATAPHKIPDFEKAVLVLGAELEGLSPSIDKICDWRTEIPLKGQVQSLNVSAAGAILMYSLTSR